MSHTRMSGYWLGVVTVGLAVGLGYVIRAQADGVPATNTLTYAGTLANSSGPLSGAHTVTVSLYSAASGGAQQCTSGPTAVTVTSTGYFSVPLPVLCTGYVAGNPNEWVDVVVDGTDTGNVQIGAVPYAVTANNAVTADNANFDAGTLGSTLTSIQSNVSTLQSQSSTYASDIGEIDAGLLARPAAMNISLSGLYQVSTGGGANVNGSTTQLLVQAGTYVAAAGSSDAGSGNVPVPFKTEFPHGLVSVNAIAGDEADGYLTVIAYDNTGFTVHASGTAGGDVRVNWIAFGW